MTPQLKEQIRGVMLSHLKHKGWPHRFNGDQVMHELPVLWTLLENAGLLQELEAKGYTYKNFAATAIKYRHRQQMKEELANRSWFRF